MPTYTLSGQYSSTGINGATIQYGSGQTFDILAALVAGGGNSKGVGGSFTVSTPDSLISALDSDPAVVRSGGGGGIAVTTPTTGYVVASLLNPTTGDSIVRQSDGTWRNVPVLDANGKVPTSHVEAAPFAKILLAGHSWPADGGASVPDFGGFHKLASHLGVGARLNSLAEGGALLCAHEGATVAGAVRFGGWGRFLNNVTAIRSAAPYPAGQQQTILCWGINDIAWTGPVTFQVAFAHAIRAMISRSRAARVEEAESSTTVTFPSGTWTTQSFVTSSGTGYKNLSTQGGQVVIAVPTDFPGGAIGLGFITNTDGGGALWDIAVAGATTQAVQHDTRNINAFDFGSTRTLTGKAMASVKRLTGLNPGAHTITLTATTLQTAALFDSWWMEAQSPGPVGVILHWRPNSYAIYAAQFPYSTIGDSDITTVNNVLLSVAAEFDSSVFTVQADDLFNKNAALFAADGLHLNDNGHGLLAQRLLDTINAQNFDLSVVSKPAVADTRWWRPVGQLGGVAFSNSWVNSGIVGDPITGYYKEWGTGTVYVKGSVKSGSSATAVVFNLPVGYRPKETVTFGLNGAGVAGVGKVTSAGDVSFVVGGNTVTGTSFNFSFLAEQ